MKEIDEFLHFLLEHESDERISFSKKMKYGYRYYYISFNIDEKSEDDNKNQSFGSLRGYRISDSIEIVVDNRNTCIELLRVIVLLQQLALSPKKLNLTLLQNVLAQYRSISFCIERL